MDFWTQYSNELARAVLPVDWPQSRTKQEYGNGDGEPLFSAALKPTYFDRQAAKRPDLRSSGLESRLPQ